MSDRYEDRVVGRDALSEADARGEVVLVVEDEVLVRMGAVDCLESIGFHVEEAGSAAEALRKMKLVKSRIIAAIIDRGLPDRRGETLVGDFRAIDADLPVIIASGYAVDGIQDSFRHDRHVGFLPKPYESDQLRSVLISLGVELPPEPNLL
jgi:CheY-like chemotaxis protein